MWLRLMRLTAQHRVSHYRLLDQAPGSGALAVGLRLQSRFQTECDSNNMSCRRLTESLSTAVRLVLMPLFLMAALLSALALPMPPAAPASLLRNSGADQVLNLALACASEEAFCDVTPILPAACPLSTLKLLQRRRASQHFVRALLRKRLKLSLRYGAGAVMRLQAVVHVTSHSYTHSLAAMGR